MNQNGPWCHTLPRALVLGDVVDGVDLYHG